MKKTSTICYQCKKNNRIRKKTTRPIPINISTKFYQSSRDIVKLWTHAGQNQRGFPLLINPLQIIKVRTAAPTANNHILNRRTEFNNYLKACTLSAKGFNPFCIGIAYLLVEQFIFRLLLPHSSPTHKK